MTYTRIAESLAEIAARVFNGSRMIAIALLATFTLVAMQPAQAQSTDTWKSIAIIGGSTAAGAYVGHKIGGATGAYIGAGIGATAGYAIDRRRRQNESYNQADNGYYDPNSGYYGNDVYNGPYDNSGYASGSQSQDYNNSGNTHRRGHSQRRHR